MTYIPRCFCAKCGSEHEVLTLYGLCERCYVKMGEKFDKALGLDYDVQKSICDEYGVRDICEAVILKKFGKPRIEEEYRCDRCKCSIDKSEARLGWTGHAHVCSSCRREIDKELGASARKDKRRFDNL